MSRAAAERQRTDPKTCVRVVRCFQSDSMTERWDATPLVAEPVADIRWLDLDAFADVKIVAAGVIQLRIVPSIDGQPAVVRVTEFRVASD